MLKPKTLFIGLLAMYAVGIFTGIKMNKAWNRDTKIDEIRKTNAELNRSLDVMYPYVNTDTSWPENNPHLYDSIEDENGVHPVRGLYDSVWRTTEGYKLRHPGSILGANPVGRFDSVIRRSDRLKRGYQEVPHYNDSTPTTFNSNHDSPLFKRLQALSDSERQAWVDGFRSLREH